MKEALIVWGGWEGHEPKRCADVVAGLLKAEGFGVQVADSTLAFADPNLRRFDLIVPILTNTTIPREDLNSLGHAVGSGTGLAGLHSGRGDSLRGEPAYQFM